MKLDRALVAQRAVARHCPELLRPAADPAADLPHLADLAKQMAPHLAQGIAALVGEQAAPMRVGDPALVSQADLLARLPGLAAASVLDCPAGQLTVAVDGAAVLQMLDRAFGGRGEAPHPLPDAFPPSARMLVERLGELARTALATALGGEAEIRLARQTPALAAALAGAPDAPSAALELTLPAGGPEQWSVLIAFPLATLSTLAGARRVPRPAPGSADPLAAPFAAIAMPINAVVVDMTVPLSAVSGLAIGAILPVAVARAVPLWIGETIVARGAIGAQDDRVAIQLTQIA